MSTAARQKRIVNIEGLSPDDVIHAAMEAGFLEKGAIRVGEERAIPLWLANILCEAGIVEIVGEKQ